MTLAVRKVPVASPEPATEKPLLVFVHSAVSGRCRRTEGYLAQVLQRRRNHQTFRLRRLDAESRPDLAERFRITALPTLLIVERRVVRDRLEAPRGCREIAAFLEPWLVQRSAPDHRSSCVIAVFECRTALSRFTRTR